MTPVASLDWAVDPATIADQICGSWTSLRSVARVDGPVERAVTVFISPPARPLFGEAAWVWRPRTDSGTQEQRSVLDYYFEVG